MTATEPQPISDADLLTFAVIGEHRARQHRQGISTLLFPFPPCPTCGAQVHDLGVSGMPIATGQTMTLRPCLHRYRITEDAMLHIGRPAWDMLEDLERHGITGTPDDLAVEARARLAGNGAAHQEADRRSPFQRKAEIAARAVNKAQAVDQTEFALAPSPTGYDGRADLARLRARLAADRDRAARNAQHAHTEQVRLVGDGIVAGLDTALRRIDDVLGEVDRSCGKPRAGGPAQPADRP